MTARPYPQKKDVDSIALNASLHPLEAPTKRSELNDFCNDNAVVKTPFSNPTGLHDSTKHKSILAVTRHLNRKQISTFNAAVPNHKTQSAKNECKTISTEERCRQYCFKCISAST